MLGRKDVTANKTVIAPVLTEPPYRGLTGADSFHFSLK